MEALRDDLVDGVVLACGRWSARKQAAERGRGERTPVGEGGLDGAELVCALDEAADLRDGEGGGEGLCHDCDDADWGVGEESEEKFRDSVCLTST